MTTPKRQTTASAYRELTARGFSGVQTAQPRCWCGRPKMVVSAPCAMGHEWPRAENLHEPWPRPGELVVQGRGFRFVLPGEPPA